MGGFTACCQGDCPSEPDAGAPVTTHYDYPAVGTVSVEAVGDIVALRVPNEDDGGGVDDASLSAALGPADPGTSGIFGRVTPGGLDASGGRAAATQETRGIKGSAASPSPTGRRSWRPLHPGSPSSGGEPGVTGCESMSSAGSRSGRPRGAKTPPRLSVMMGVDDIRQNDSFEDLPEDWSQLRRAVHKTLTYTHPATGLAVFDTSISIIVVSNIVIMIMETDWAAQCLLDDPEDCIPHWAGVLNNVLLAVYTLELCTRFFAYRCACFRSKWVVLDMVIVGVGLAGIALADIPELKRVNVLRVMRVARILRFLRILKRFPTLSNMIGGFTGAMQVMFWGIVMILMLLVAWSLFAVELINPVSKRIFTEEDSWCRNAFSSVLFSTLLFFQTLVAGDSWGACAIPVIEEAAWAYFIFAGALVSVQLGFTNLVLAIIVDKAAEAREGSKEEQRAQRAKQQIESFEAWRRIMEEIDADQSGSISEQELIEGYAHPLVKETLEQMNISKQDLRGLFQLMDLDGTGQLSYHQFLDAFFKAQTQDPKIYMMVMQLRMAKIEAEMSENFDRRMQDLTSAVQGALRAAGVAAGGGGGRPRSAPESRAASPERARRPGDPVLTWF